MLRAIGSMDLMAIIAVLAPRDWIAATHRWLGLGEFPHEPVAGYLARSTSIWFAIYGLLLWFVSFDIQKYSNLIRFLAWILVFHGFAIAGVDLAEGMPTWWIPTEGLFCSGMGCCLLWLQRGASTTDKGD
jgi:hypothetical protein